MWNFSNSTYAQSTWNLYSMCNTSYGFPYNNTDQCLSYNFLKRFFHSSDLDFDLYNPFSIVFYFWPRDQSSQYTFANITDPPYKLDFNEFFLAICYAYSLFRLVIDFSVIFYAHFKIKKMLSDNELKERIQADHDLDFEISFYKYIIYAAVSFELVMSVHNFIFWRGFQYYTSAQDNYFPIYIKPPRVCNCMYNPALYNWDYTNYTEFYPEKIRGLQAGYWLWIGFESCGMFIVYFSVLTLSRINRKDKKGWNFLRNIVKKSIFLSFFYGFLLMLLIFEFDTPVFYKFYNYQVLAFWFFWKTIGFILLLDRLYSKYGLFKSLKIKTLHNQAHLWLWKIKTSELQDLKRNKIQENEVDQFVQNKEIQKYMKNHLNEINQILKDKIRESYEQIEDYVRKMRKKARDSKLKINWQDYLNYFLGLNLIGAIGYFWLLVDVIEIHVSKNGVFDPQNDHVSRYYYMGIFFCYTEIIIFDLTHGIFLLHCFFIELVEFLNRNKEYVEKKGREYDLL